MTMLMQCLSAVCVLIVVIVGLLVMTRIVGLEELGHGIWRCFLMLVVAFVALWLLKVLLLPMLVCGLVWLKGVMLKAVVIVVVIIAFTSLLGMLFAKGTTWKRRGKQQREKL